MKHIENPCMFRPTEEMQSDVCEGLMKALECTCQASIFPLKLCPALMLDIKSYSRSLRWRDLWGIGRQADLN